MRTWLLVWNPNRWAWDDQVEGYWEAREEIEQIGFSIQKWSCGVNKSIQQGDRIFLIKVGKEPRGMIASGYALSKSFEGTHWDLEKRAQGKKIHRVYVSFDSIRTDDAIMPMKKLIDLAGNYHWSSQASGVEIPDSIAQKLENYWETPGKIVL